VTGSRDPIEVEGRVSIRPLGALQPEEISVDDREKVVALEALVIGEGRVIERAGLLRDCTETRDFRFQPLPTPVGNLPAYSRRPAANAAIGCASNQAATKPSTKAGQSVLACVGGGAAAAGAASVAGRLPQAPIAKDSMTTATVSAVRMARSGNR